MVNVFVVRIYELHLDLENKATRVTQSVIPISSGWVIKGISMYIWKNGSKQTFHEQ